MEISDLIYLENKTQAEALAEAKKLNGRILTNREYDHLIQQGILTEGPYWTGTHLDYEGTRCVITENGRSVERNMPEKDGWFEQDEFGLPFGKKSKQSDEKARCLWRIEKNTGLVSRGYGGWCDRLRRGVDCDDGPDVRLGVVILCNSGDSK